MSRPAAPPRQAVHGVVLLHKPRGDSSQQAVSKVKRFFNAAKAGHGGTLDPLATGLLVVMLGEATKFSQGLLDAEKTYEFDIKLGEVRDTGDLEGEVIAQSDVSFDVLNADYRGVTQQFLGTQLQTPPLYSALKIAGKPLYEYARRGVAVDVSSKAREITVSALSIMALDAQHLRCVATVSKGTYIRTLAQDIGAALGCGGVVVRLHRTQIAGYSLSAAVDYAGLGLEGEQALHAVDTLVAALPAVQLSPAQTDLVHNGGRLRWEDGEQPITVRLYGTHQAAQAHNGFMGVAQIANNRLQPQRLCRYGE